MKRMKSPFDPSKAAYLEPIEQDIYSSNVLTAASPERKIAFFPVPSASQGDPLLSNVNDNKLANPKLYIVRGWRLHAAQKSDGLDTTFNQFTGLVTILENYVFNFFVGTKDYLNMPAFAMASGFGAFLSVATTVNNTHAYTSTMGQPLQENYRKLRRNEITIPPMQEFKASLDMGNTTLASFVATGTTRRFHCFIVGTLGRESQRVPANDSYSNVPTRSIALGGAESHEVYPLAGTPMSCKARLEF